MPGKSLHPKLHKADSAVLRLDLMARSNAIMAAARESANGRAARTLVNEGPLRIVILGFSAGASMDQHQAPGVSCLQLLRGLLTIAVADQLVNLTTGDCLVLEAGLSHSVKAQADSALLLTFAAL